MAVGVERVLGMLDDRQRAAVELGPGPAQVIAPAGSGKTATLVARIGVLLAAGEPADRILVVTFNRDAATELADRIAEAWGVRPGSGGPEVRTLHALARQVVLDAGRPVRLVADRLPLLRQARRLCQARLSPEFDLPAAEELDGTLSAAILEHRPLPRPVAEVLATYRDLLATRGQLDFDGLMVGALDLLRGDGSLRERWQARYRHVLVDEFQDVDGTQLELVAILAEPERNLFVVGDDDQTIYAWRLADVKQAGLQSHSLTEALDGHAEYPEWAPLQNNLGAPVLHPHLCQGKDRRRQIVIGERRVRVCVAGSGVPPSHVTGHGINVDARDLGSSDRWDDPDRRHDGNQEHSQDRCQPSPARHKAKP